MIILPDYALRISLGTFSILPTTDETKTLDASFVVCRVRILYTCIVYILSPVRVKKLEFGFDLRKYSFNDGYTCILVP